jgi:penicillin-binding protein 1A
MWSRAQPRLRAIEARLRPAAIGLTIAVAAVASARLVLASGPAQRHLTARADEVLARRTGLSSHVGGVAIGWHGDVVLADVDVDLGHGAALQVARVVLHLAYGELCRGHLQPSAIDLRGARLSWHSETRSLDWQLPPLAVTPLADTHGSATVSARFDDGSEADAAVHFEPRVGATVDARLTAFGVGNLPPALLARLPVAVRGSLEAQLHLEAAPDMSLVQADWSIATPDLALESPELDSAAIGPLPLRASGSATLDQLAGRLAVTDFQLSYGSAATPILRAQAQVETAAAGALEVGASLAELDVDAVLRELPAPLLPGEHAPSPSGLLGGQLRLSGPTWRPADWTVEGHLDLSRLTARLPADAPAVAASFVHHATDAAGREYAFEVGPQNPDFVPLAELPKHVADAVTTSEDGGFYTHRGFDFDEIKRSILAVAEAGRAVRGGSTITQQLAKNLFLSRQKTYARKAREALITLALEAELPKARLLEIYLNIIEWGPGLFGIAQAAHHYFGKDPRELSVKEAVYLASIIPSPSRYYVYFERRAPSEAWLARLDGILAKMTENGVLESDAYDEALASPLVFPPN